MKSFLGGLTHNLLTIMQRPRLQEKSSGLLIPRPPPERRPRPHLDCASGRGGTQVRDGGRTRSIPAGCRPEGVAYALCALLSTTTRSPTWKHKDPI